MIRDAVISPCGQYRYSLYRCWDKGPRAVFIMLNPSTADHQKDDPTIRKCIGFCNIWGYGQFTVVNLYAYRATDPKDLKKAGYPVGPDNDLHISEAIQSAALVVAAWGAKSRSDRAEYVGRTMHPERALQFQCLGHNNDGSPKHPLMQPYSAALRSYWVGGW